MSATFPYRLAVFDMDDTLLGPDKKISPENRSTLAIIASEKNRTGIGHSSLILINIVTLLYN